MPKKYEEMKSSLRKAHPSWGDKKVKEVAARTYNKYKKAGDPSLHHGKKK
jgi:hypothetical protein